MGAKLSSKLCICGFCFCSCNNTYEVIQEIPKEIKEIRKEYYQMYPQGDDIDYIIKCLQNYKNPYGDEIRTIVEYVPGSHIIFNKTGANIILTSINASIIKLNKGSTHKGLPGPGKQICYKYVKLREDDDPVQYIITIDSYKYGNYKVQLETLYS